MNDNSMRYQMNKKPGPLTDEERESWKVANAAERVAILREAPSIVMKGVQRGWVQRAKPEQPTANVSWFRRREKPTTEGVL